MAKDILVSGIQPSGRLHIGNYLGALKNFVDLQNEGKYECYFFLADLHSLTEFPESAKEQRERILELAADYLAAGLDPKKSLIYQQSRISAHTELAWILNTITPLGELQRMTQFKDKAGFNIQGDNANSREGLTATEIRNRVRRTIERELSVNTGLLTYPTLMAADIILYDAKFVPVGNDQDQHLELTRTLARKFNNKFGKTFIEPKALHTPTPRVMSLKNPLKKMSKSQPETCLFLDDSPEEIKRKVMAATTDSGNEIRFDPEKKPGIANLLGIYAGATGHEVKKLEKNFAVKTYAEFKQDLAEALVNHLADYRTKKKELLKKPEVLGTILAESSARAAEKADAKMALVKKKVGLTV